MSTTLEPAGSPLNEAAEIFCGVCALHHAGDERAQVTPPPYEQAWHGARGAGEQYSHGFIPYLFRTGWQAFFAGVVTGFVGLGAGSFLPLSLIVTGFLSAGWVCPGPQANNCVVVLLHDGETSYRHLCADVCRQLHSIRQQSQLFGIITHSRAECYWKSSC
jgi:hypothetical protein